MRVCLGPFSEANMAPGKGPLISLRSLVAHYWYGASYFVPVWNSLEFLPAKSQGSVTGPGGVLLAMRSVAGNSPRPVAPSGSLHPPHQ